MKNNSIQMIKGGKIDVEIAGQKIKAQGAIVWLMIVLGAGLIVLYLQAKYKLFSRAGKHVHNKIKSRRKK